MIAYLDVEVKCPVPILQTEHASSGQSDPLRENRAGDVETEEAPFCGWKSVWELATSPLVS